MKIAINKCYGGFHPSNTALIEYLKRKDIKFTVKQLVYKKGKPFRETLEDFQGNIDNLEIYFYPENSEDYLDLDYDSKEFRTDPIFIELVKELGKRINSDESNIKIIEIPDDIKYEIEENDGIEWVAESHRKWS